MHTHGEHEGCCPRGAHGLQVRAAVQEREEGLQMPPPSGKVDGLNAVTGGL